MNNTTTNYNNNDNYLELMLAVIAQAQEDAKDDRHPRYQKDAIAYLERMQAILMGE